jgi:hypothetical protein
MKRALGGSTARDRAGLPMGQGYRSPPSLFANTYLCGAVTPKDGTCIYLIMPAPDTECSQIFLKRLARKYRRQLILLFVDGVGNHHSDELEVPHNVMLHLLRPYSPELNPQENLWDEIREKIFKNHASNQWKTSTPSLRRPQSTSNVQRS